MEKQTNWVFKQKNKWGLTVLAAVLCLLLSPLMSMSLFMPQMFALLPVLALLLLGYVGPVSASVCMGVFVSVTAIFYGTWGALIGAILMIPVVAVSAAVLEREQPFWQSVAAGSVTLFASMGAAIGIIAMITGSDVVTAITDMVRQGMSISGAMSDSLLSMLIQMGMLTLPEGAAQGAVLDQAMREELVSTLLMMTDSVMRLEMPMQMATGAVTAGLLGQAALRKGVNARGAKVEYPVLSSWRVPKGWGRILGGTLVVLYVLAQMIPQSMSTMFYVFSGVFDKIFALQGVAAICYIIRDKGKPAFLQALVFVLGYFVLGSFAVVLGIADQVMDFTHRRVYLDKLENPFDPRHGA
ncbi:MAG: DUF2232 domain-containing protein [Clostridia bacterium]|nr:DUF2232 domain-containing protein [Clostridia bacterium]